MLLTTAIQHTSPTLKLRKCFFSFFFSSIYNKVKLKKKSGTAVCVLLGEMKASLKATWKKKRF